MKNRTEKSPSPPSCSATPAPRAAADDVITAQNPQNNMYLNGNSPFYGGYYPNRFLPFATSTPQTAVAENSARPRPPPPPPPISNGGSAHRSNGGFRSNNTNLSDTITVAGDDLSNVPAAVIIQLEKANRTIAAQIVEIDRLKSFQNQNVETHLLRQQIGELEKEMRSSRARFLEQQELLAEMSREMDNLEREKVKMSTTLRELEKKYKKAKYASRELAKILENDLCGSPSTKMLQNGNGFESDDEHESSLFHRSRSLSRQQESSSVKSKAELAIELAEKQKQQEEALESRQFTERLMDENEELQIQLERERRMTESLQDDLEKSRRLVIERDERLEELRGKLLKSEAKATQSEGDLSRTSTDLALERARCDALTLELHELDAIFQQTQSTVQAFAVENEQLEENCRAQHKTIITLNAKLEAQGIDLITTKRTLRTLRESEHQRSGPF